MAMDGNVGSRVVKVVVAVVVVMVAMVMAAVAILAVAVGGDCKCEHRCWQLAMDSSATRLKHQTLPTDPSH